MYLVQTAKTDTETFADALELWIKSINTMQSKGEDNQLF